METQPYQPPTEFGPIQVFEKVYDYIAFTAAQHGVSISEVCRQADVDRSVVERWKEDDPKSIQTFRKLQTVLGTLGAMPDQTV